MRYLVLLFAFISAVAAYPDPASAEQGYRAKFTSTITITSEFDKLLQAAAAKAHGKPDAMSEPASNMEIDPVIGNLYFTRSKIRLDYEIRLNGMVVTTIVDLAAKKYIILNHARREAYTVDFAALADLDQAIGFPVSYPDQMFGRWHDLQQQLNAIPSFKMKDLGVKKIAGETCRGVAISANLADVFKADGYTPLANIPPITDIKGKWSGEFWMSDRLGLPVTMDMHLLGVHSKWELSQIEEWRAIDALLSVPREYVVHPIGASEMIQSLSLGAPKL